MGNLNNKFSNVTTKKKLSQRVISLVLALTLVLSMTAIGFSASAAEVNSEIRKASLADTHTVKMDGKKVSYGNTIKDEPVLKYDDGDELVDAEYIEMGKTRDYYLTITPQDGYKVCNTSNTDVQVVVQGYDNDSEKTDSFSTNTDFTKSNPYDGDDTTGRYKFNVSALWTSGKFSSSSSVKVELTINVKKEDASTYEIKGWADKPESTDGGTTYGKAKYFKTNDLVAPVGGSTAPSDNISATTNIEEGDEVKLYVSASTPTSIVFNSEEYNPEHYRYYIDKIVAVGVKSGTEYPLTFDVKNNMYKFNMPAENVRLKYQIKTESAINVTTYNAVNDTENLEKYTVKATVDEKDWNKVTITYTANDGYYFNGIVDTADSMLKTSLKAVALSETQIMDRRTIAEKGDKVKDVKSTKAYDKTYVTEFTCECNLKNVATQLNGIWNEFAAMDNNIYILTVGLTEGSDIKAFGYTVVPDSSLTGGKFETSKTVVAYGSDFDATLKLESGYTYQADSIKIYKNDGTVKCVYNQGDNGTTDSQSFDKAWVVKKGADQDGNPTWNIKTSSNNNGEIYLTATINKNSGEQADGWKQVNGKWQYVKNGTPLTGWVSNIPGWEGQWFYFDPATGNASSAWECSIPGWIGKWFYFDANTCVMKKGWVNDGGDSWYYLGGDGVMVTGWQWLSWSQGTNWFFFVPTGQMAKNTTTPDGFTLDANGVWR